MRDEPKERLRRRLGSGSSAKGLAGSVTLAYVWVIYQVRGQDGSILAKCFFVCLWAETPSRSINTQEKNEGNI